MALRPKIYHDKMVTKYVDSESAALHDNVQISHERVTKVRAGAGLFNVLNSRPGTTSEYNPSYQPSRGGVRHRNSPGKHENVLDELLDGSQNNAQAQEFLQMYMSTNKFDEKMFLEKEQMISDFFKEKYRAMGKFLGEDVLAELLNKAKSKDKNGLEAQLNANKRENSPKNTDRKNTLTLMSEDGMIPQKKNKTSRNSKRTETDGSKMYSIGEIDKKILSEYELERYEEFKEKFKNMGILLGDSILNPLKEAHKKKLFSDFDPNDEKTKKELENLKIDPDQFALKDQALTKVLKINKDIIQQILREEHENKLKKLEQLQVEQNMQVFNALSENPRLTIVNNDTAKKRSLSPKEKVQKLPKHIYKTNFLREELFEEDDDNELDIFYKSPGEIRDHIHDTIQKKMSEPNNEIKPKTAAAVAMNSTQKSLALPFHNPRPNTVDFKFRFNKIDFTSKIVTALEHNKYNTEDGHIKSTKNSEVMKQMGLSNLNSPYEMRSNKSEARLPDLGSPTSQFAQTHYLGFPSTTKHSVVELKPDMLLSESIHFLKIEKDRVKHDFKAKFKSPPKTTEAKIRPKIHTAQFTKTTEEMGSSLGLDQVKSSEFFEAFENLDDLDPALYEEPQKKEKPLFPKVLYPRKPLKPATAAASQGRLTNLSPKNQQKGSPRSLIKVNRLQPSQVLNTQQTYVTSGHEMLSPTSIGFFKPKAGNFYTRMHQTLASKEAMFDEIKKNEQYKTHIRGVDHTAGGLMIQAGGAQILSQTAKHDHKKNKFSLTVGAGMWRNNS